MLKYAHVELELIPRSPWEGLDIEQITTHLRRPWTHDELQTIFSAPLHTEYRLPNDPKAGGEAAYWVPLLGLYSGGPVSELVQLRRRDIELVGDIPVMSVTDEGEARKVKTIASLKRTALQGDDPLWPTVPLRAGKSGGFFSQWSEPVVVAWGSVDTPASTACATLSEVHWRTWRWPSP